MWGVGDWAKHYLSKKMKIYTTAHYDFFFGEYQNGDYDNKH